MLYPRLTSPRTTVGFPGSPTGWCVERTLRRFRSVHRHDDQTGAGQAEDVQGVVDGSLEVLYLVTVLPGVPVQAAEDRHRLGSTVSSFGDQA